MYSIFCVPNTIKTTTRRSNMRLVKTSRKEKLYIMDRAGERCEWVAVVEDGRATKGRRCDERNPRKLRVYSIDVKSLGSTTPLVISFYMCANHWNTWSEGLLKKK